MLAALGIENISTFSDGFSLQGLRGDLFSERGERKERACRSGEAQWRAHDLKHQGEWLQLKRKRPGSRRALIGRILLLLVFVSIFCVCTHVRIPLHVCTCAHKPMLEKVRVCDIRTLTGGKEVQKTAKDVQELTKNVNVEGKRDALLASTAAADDAARVRYNVCMSINSF